MGLKREVQTMEVWLVRLQWEVTTLSGPLMRYFGLRICGTELLLYWHN